MASVLCATDVFFCRFGGEVCDGNNDGDSDGDGNGDKRAGDGVRGSLSTWPGGASESAEAFNFSFNRRLLSSLRFLSIVLIADGAYIDVAIATRSESLLVNWWVGAFSSCVILTCRRHDLYFELVF
jgi:hypothetical protein